MQVVVIYGSTRGRTKAMATAICEGVKSSGVDCELVEARHFKALGDACALAVGASTRMKRPLPQVRQILSQLPKLNGMSAAGFGSYGWSGEAPDEIAAQLRNLGAKLVEGQPLKAKDYPNQTALEKCKELGQNLAKNCS